MATHIIHHTDLDGITSLAVIALSIDNAEQAINHPYNYRNQDFLPDVDNYINNDIAIKKDDTVYIVDISLNEDIGWKILETGARIIWIDHHQTSIDLCKNFARFAEIEGIRDSSKCGAMLCCDFTGLNYQKMYQSDISFVQYVDDHDRWVHQYPNTKLLTSGFNTIYGDLLNIKSNSMKEWPLHPHSPFWYLLHDLYPITENYLNLMIEAGKIVQSFKDWDYSNARRNVFAGRLKLEHITEDCNVDETIDVSMVCLNRLGNSDMFGEMYEKYDICICYAQNYNKLTKKFEWKYTAYSHYADKGVCNKIAEIMGGGGHPGAAGFVLENNILQEPDGFGDWSVIASID